MWCLEGKLTSACSRQPGPVGISESNMRLILEEICLAPYGSIVWSNSDSCVCHHTVPVEPVSDLRFRRVHHGRLCGRLRVADEGTLAQASRVSTIRIRASVGRVEFNTLNS